MKTISLNNATEARQPLPPPKRIDPPTEAPDPRKLAGLFPPFSKGRRALTEHRAILNRFSPAAPPYVSWNLARYTKTLGLLSNFLSAGNRWLDISSDPWFCLLANQRFPGVDLTSTALTTEEVDFREASGGGCYRHTPVALELSEKTTEFRVGTGYDEVTAFEVIEHLQFHPTPFLMGVSDALRDGGKLILTTPNVASWSVIYRLFRGQPPHQTRAYGGPMDHRKEYTVHEMKLLLNSAGFRVDYIRTFNCYTNDRLGVLANALYLGVLGWHAATLRAVPVRNLLFRSGSTMLIAATKVGPCQPSEVIEV